ncbi:MAG: AAA family ATPase [Chryseobacterium sp.]|nr:AAA family ATPase [Candidatus Chryseobacterium enterohippi]
MMKEKNPIAKISESIVELRNFINQELLPAKEENTEAKNLIEELHLENTKLLSLCKELNNHAKFIDKINNRVDRSKIKGYYKTEHLFLSEIIDIENKNKSASPQSGFVLAYYYDVLRNNHFADADSAQVFDEFVNSKEFQNVVAKVKLENVIKANSETEKNLILSILTELNHPLLEEIKNRFLNFRYLTQNKEVEEIIIADEAEKAEEPINNAITFPLEEDTLEKALEELHQLIGLEKVKADISELINLLNIQKKRTAEGLKNVELSLHTVFLGPPGTGKTTVARLLGRIFKHLGYLSVGQVYETDREGLVAGYVGQTAIKTDKVVEESKGGVLFIDEAYALTQNASGNDFGAEAVNTIIKRMEDYRDDLSVVVAGYTEPMQFFIESNPGLRSRFNRYFYFEHFNADQLLSIFENFCKKSDFELSDEARTKVMDTFEMIEPYKTESFGNARVVRNLFEKTVQKQANRLIHWTAPKDEQLKMLYEEDIPEPQDSINAIKSEVEEENI